jgi:hypothetical protein
MEKTSGVEEVYVPSGAWLLIGIGGALLIGTLLLFLTIPSDRRRHRPRFSPPRLSVPSFTIPAGSPVGALLKGFSYLYAPLDYPNVRRNVAGRMGDAIARIDAVEPIAAPERIGQAVQEMADRVGPEEWPAAPDPEPPINIFDRRREQARREEQA